MIQGMILDIDGTLVLSNDQHAAAWVEAFAACGYDVAYDRVRPLIGMGGDKLVPELVPGLSSTEGAGKQVADRRKQIFRERYLAELGPSPGSRALLEQLQALGVQLAIASSAESDELSEIVKAAGLDGLVQTITSSSDAAESKPAPDIVASALDKLQLPAGAVLMLGDTPYDIISARSAGIDTLAVRCGGFADKELAGAIAVYDDPADLLAHLDESPVMSTEQSA